MWRQKAYTLSGHPLNDEQGANMTDLRKAAEMALAKFEHLWEIGIDAEYKVELLPEIQALRQSIEQAEKQEPKRDKPLRLSPMYEYGHIHDAELPWVGLHWDDMPEEYAGDKSFLDGAKWAEAKLKGKNT
jgi:hypothetical protein